jgi:hypothetical protein
MVNPKRAHRDHYRSVVGRYAIDPKLMAWQLLQLLTVLLHCHTN